MERINALGTLRLFALKDWSAIKDADPKIRMLGQELDLAIRDWSKRKRNIEVLKTLRQVGWVSKAGPADSKIVDGERLYHVPELEVVKEMPTHAGTRWERFKAIFMPQKQASAYRAQLVEEALGDLRNQCLYELTRRKEGQLVQLGATLDELGGKASGGFHFRLNRSAYYIEEFRVLLRTLHVGNIPTWISYEQFVVRGLSPAFDFIASVSKRLASLRERLQNVIAAIETSALVVQSAATRHNTDQLRKLVRLGWRIGAPSAAFLLVKLLQAFGLWPALWRF